MHGFRYSLRVLWRDRGYAAVAVLTMALGIGATTTIFSVVYSVSMKPLPFPDAERLMRVVESRAGHQARLPRTVSNGAYYAWRDADGCALLVLRDAARIGLVGVSLGVVGAYAATAYLGAFLYGVGRTDAVSYALIAVAVALVTGVACIIPARRGSIRSLHSEAISSGQVSKLERELERATQTGRFLACFGRFALLPQPA